MLTVCACLFRKRGETWRSREGAVFTEAQWRSSRWGKEHLSAARWSSPLTRKGWHRRKVESDQLIWYKELKCTLTKWLMFTEHSAFSASISRRKAIFSGWRGSEVDTRKSMKSMHWNKHKHMSLTLFIHSYRMCQLMIYLTQMHHKSGLGLFAFISCCFFIYKKTIKHKKLCLY